MPMLRRPSSSGGEICDGRSFLAYLQKAFSSDATTQVTWKDLTPLAQNEWICSVISAKQGATRSRRIQRAVEELKEGKRRPCCWPGCPHRRPSARKWF